MTWKKPTSPKSPRPSERQRLVRHTRRLNMSFMQSHFKCQHSTSRSPTPVSYSALRSVSGITHLAGGSPLSLGRLIQTNLFKLDALVGASMHETHIEPRESTLPLNQERGAVFPLLSQGEHPTLQIPCWYFHPCETGVAVGELLAIGIQNAAERRTLCHWLEAWMAMLGVVVNLRT